MFACIIVNALQVCDKRAGYTSDASIRIRDVNITGKHLFLWILSMCKLRQITHKLSLSNSICVIKMFQRLPKCQSLETTEGKQIRRIPALDIIEL